MDEEYLEMIERLNLFREGIGESMLKRFEELYHELKIYLIKQGFTEEEAKEFLSEETNEVYEEIQIH